MNTCIISSKTIFLADVAIAASRPWEAWDTENGVPRFYTIIFVMATTSYVTMSNLSDEEFKSGVCPAKEKITENSATLHLIRDISDLTLLFQEVEFLSFY